MNYFAWFDTETTGLDDDAALLEVGFVLTDSDLNILWQKDWLTETIKTCMFGPVDGVREEQALCNDFVREMHNKNNLWGDRMTKPLTMPGAMQEEIATKIYELGIEAKEVPMAGSTVGFDRATLKREIPNLESMFHYRSIDVSSIKELAKVWNPSVYRLRPGQDESKKEHRALADVLTSIEELKHYRNLFFFRQVSSVLGN